MFCGTYAKQVSEVEGTRKHNPRERMKNSGRGAEKKNEVPAKKKFRRTYAKHVFGTQGVGKK
jgi:hypothetical protein